jgi:hypothetical protein
MLTVATAMAAPTGPNDRDVFRYESEDKSSYHFMKGESGRSVEGGWGFESPEGKVMADHQVIHIVSNTVVAIRCSS